MSAITIDNNLVHYEVLGRGRPVILVHGWLGSWRYWIPTMQFLSVKYRVYALDLWGFGDTEKEPARYSFTSQVKLLTDFMDKLGIAKAAIIGHSLGAAITINFTRQFPERAPRVVLVSPPLYDMGGIGAPAAAGPTLPPPASAPAVPPAPPASSVPAAPVQTAPATTAVPASASPATPISTASRPSTPVAPTPAVQNSPAPTPAASSTASAPASAVPTPTAAPRQNDSADTLPRNPFRDSPEKLAELQAIAAARGIIGLPAATPKPPVDPLAQPAQRPEGPNPLVNLLSTINPRAVLDRQLARDDENLTKLRADVDKMDATVLVKSAPSFAGVNLAQQLSQLKSPVLLFHGKDDQFIEPQEEVVTKIASLKGDGEFLPFVVPEFKHFPMLESGAKFNRLLMDFLDAPDLTNVQMKETWRRQLR